MSGQGIRGWKVLEEEGWEMVSLPGNSIETPRKVGSKRGGAGSVRVRHLPIPEIPRPPRSRPITIPKLIARREGRPLSLTWDSQFEGEAKDLGTSGPRGFGEESVLRFPSVVSGGQWLWPECARSSQDQWLTPEVRPRTPPSPHKSRTPPSEPYTVPYSEEEDRETFERGIRTRGRWEGMEAPFLHSFMPIPRMEFYDPLEDLPMDLSKMNL